MKSIRQLLSLIFFCYSVTIVNLVAAHEQSFSQIIIASSKQTSEENQYDFTWQILMTDLTQVIDLDDNQDNKIQWREVTRNIARLNQLVLNNLIIRDDQAINNNVTNDIKLSCPINITEFNVQPSPTGEIMTLAGVVNCNSNINSIEYRFLADLDALHTAYLNFQQNETTDYYLFNHDNRVVSPQITDSSGFLNYIWQGLIHILIGLDHLAFLLVLLFSAQATDRFDKSSASKLLAFVTAFTIAHSLTLISASLNFISLPSWLVESVIAATVGWGALLAIKGKHFINTVTVFAFGLIHGLGFASVLAELNSGIANNVLLLLGFNLGVELGQILFLLVAFATIYLPLKLFGTTKVTRTICAPVLLLSVVWVIERLSDYEILGI